MNKKLRKRRRRVHKQRPSGRPLLGSDAARFRLATRLSLGLGITLMLAAHLQPYLLPSWSRTPASPLSMALRLAGVALIIAAVMFHRADSHK
jgi:hypothetical protein